MQHVSQCLWLFYNLFISCKLQRFAQFRLFIDLIFGILIALPGKISEQ